MKYMRIFLGIFMKRQRSDSDFSHFIREASSREKKRVFLDVLEKATQDQLKIVNTKVTK